MTSQFIGGKPAGSLIPRPRKDVISYQVLFTKSTGISSRLFSSLDEAKTWQQDTSDQYNLTKNKYRIVIDEGQPYVEVQLQGDHTMKCDIEHLPLVQERIWTANKTADKYCWYVKSRASKKRDQDYCLFHRRAYPHIKEIDHINRDGLDNRSCNIREGSGRVNATNRRIQKNNTSGHKGVRFEKGAKARWKAQWVDKESGKRRTKSFSVAKYGEEEAKKLAIAWRLKHAPCPEDLC